ncbi:hypothetical protein W911_15710 [Hyphomicrobium nitrativorans NL23]|uniref:CAAX prenyl protease 2/Lysostaphin resistance protein A-like domain-containing protein n=1 Tax=Hyphomicrobium nitrativorans NL23 TaxID=1029756 RepID=V5SIS5_9HYPH|nr:type II CAAX endopeptidase family protein [Hyphomicrobium nitrativorans]AHB50392.1 hypothetical protein W911_15710 [Hyphomicrobium nitrativorans NL23]
MTEIASPDSTRSPYRAQGPWGPGAAVAIAIVASLAPALIGIAFIAGLFEADMASLENAGSLASPMLLGQMIAGQILSLLIIWWAAGRKGQRAQVLQLSPERETSVLTAVGLGLLLIVAIGPIEVLLYRLADIDLFTDGRWLLEGLRSPYWWGVVIAAVVLAPLWEEVTFRGFLLSALAKTRLGFWPAAAISAALWTALHAGYSWPGLVSVFLAGLGLSWIMKRTGSMRAVVIAHAVINAFALTVISTFA